MSNAITPDAFYLFIFLIRLFFESVGFKTEIGNNVLGHVTVIFIQKQKNSYQNIY